jgi:hypothetical protein
LALQTLVIILGLPIFSFAIDPKEKEISVKVMTQILLLC